MDGPAVLHLTGGLEVGGGVGGGAAASPHQENPGCLGLLLLGVLQDHPGVVTLRVNVVRAGVVDLQDQVLDVGVGPHPEADPLGQLQRLGVHGPGVDDLGAAGTDRVVLQAGLGDGHLAAVPGGADVARLLAAVHQHVVGRHLGGVGLEADNVISVLGVHPDRSAEVGLSQAGHHSRHQQGKLGNCGGGILQTYGWLVLSHWKQSQLAKSDVGGGER